MKNKKLNKIKFILANLIILNIFLLILTVVPNNTSCNFITCFLYVLVATLFNIIILEED